LDISCDLTSQLPGYSSGVRARRPVLFLLFLLSLAASARAQEDSGPVTAASAPEAIAVPDLEALVRARPIPTDHAAILVPSLGLPALVTPGDTVAVHLAGTCAETSEVWGELVLVGAEPPVRVPLGRVDAGHSSPIFRVPLDLAADVYHLRVEVPGCTAVDGTAPVRVARTDHDLVAVVADEQLGDPRSLLPAFGLEGNLYPTWVPGDLAATRRVQVRNELAFRDPLVVLYPGDVVFGMHPTREYAETKALWRATPLAVLAVPGNHDAYAVHDVSFGESRAVALGRALGCGLYVHPASMFGTVVGVGGCMVAALSEALELQLRVDGLEAYRASLGSEAWSLGWRGTRFIGVNTFGGSAERRMAVPISLGRIEEGIGRTIPGTGDIDRDLGAPLTDNHGGTVDPEVVAWVRGEVDAAGARGEEVVLVAHHDPSGSHRGSAALFRNDPFGTDPMARGGFEVWNYGLLGEAQPTESASLHSGTHLLSATTSGPTTWILGHTHRDDRRQVHHADQPVDLIQTTTAGSLPMDLDGYRGYRLLQLGEAGLGVVDADTNRGWASVPLGHLWVEELPRPEGVADRVVVNGLPHAVSGRLRFVLPATVTGYAFTTFTGEVLSLSDLTWTEGVLVAYVDVEVPPGTGDPLARLPDEQTRVVVHWEPAIDNLPPAAQLVPNGKKPRPLTRPVRTRVRRPLTLAAVPPDDEALFRVVWELAGEERAGTEAHFEPLARGRYPLVVTLYDGNGVRTVVEGEVRVRRRFWPPW
jgi:3',5'-cyclic AMP phosphodiesterase CpdA